MDGLGVFHVVSFEGGGFAVTSGDTEMTPILAYSEDGEFVANDENPLWVMLTRDVAGRAKRLGEDVSAAKNAKDAQADEEDVEYGAEEDEAAAASQASQASQPSPNASAWARLRAAAAPLDQLFPAKQDLHQSLARCVFHDAVTSQSFFAFYLLVAGFRDFTHLFCKVFENQRFAQIVEFILCKKEPLPGLDSGEERQRFY